MLLEQAPTVDPSTLPTSFNCNFETNLCGLKQLPDDNFDWTRQRGKTPSTGTGPSTDHTLVRYFDQFVLYFAADYVY